MARVPPGFGYAVVEEAWDAFLRLWGPPPTRPPGTCPVYGCGERGGEKKETPAEGRDVG